MLSELTSVERFLKWRTERKINIDAKSTAPISTSPSHEVQSNQKSGLDKNLRIVKIKNIANQERLNLKNLSFLENPHQTTATAKITGTSPLKRLKSHKNTLTALFPPKEGALKIVSQKLGSYHQRVNAQPTKTTMATFFKPSSHF